MANMKPIKVKYWCDYIDKHPKFTGCLINKYNDVAWYKNGKRHREDGLPAIEYGNGHKEWFKKGFVHREDGHPAIEFANGYKEWWLNDMRYNSEEEYRIALRKIKLERVLKQIEG